MTTVSVAAPVRCRREDLPGCFLLPPGLRPVFANHTASRWRCRFPEKAPGSTDPDPTTTSVPLTLYVPMGTAPRFGSLSAPIRIKRRGDRYPNSGGFRHRPQAPACELFASEPLVIAVGRICGCMVRLSVAADPRLTVLRSELAARGTAET